MARYVNRINDGDRFPNTTQFLQQPNFLEAAGEAIGKAASDVKEEIKDGKEKVKSFI